MFTTSIETSIKPTLAEELRDKAMDQITNSSAIANTILAKAEDCAKKGEFCHSWNIPIDEEMYNLCHYFFNHGFYVEYKLVEIQEDDEHNWISLNWSGKLAPNVVYLSK